VLDRDAKLVDKWYKSFDKQSFSMARRLIRSEGLLCGGSSGAAVAGAIQAIKDFGMKKGQRVVVILPDSVRNYMTKFLNDDWMRVNGFTDDEPTESKKEIENYGDFTVADLKLAPAITVGGTATCESALEILNKAGIDQVPVVDADKKVVGIVTVGHMLSKITKKLAKGSDPVTAVMFQFNTKRPYVEITTQTKLGDLVNFFEKNSSAIVTEKGAVKHVVTKVDLVKFIMKGH
jgi:cystathionine beta-synthase